MATELLRRAVELACALPSEDQDHIAQLILAELEDEARWDAAFRAGAPTLSKLADKAVLDFREGRTSPADDLLG